MLLMFLRILGKDEYVIDKHPHKYSQVISKNIIDNSLEYWWCVAEAKRHNHPFKGSIRCIEGSLFDIFVVDSDPQRAQYGLVRR